MNLCSVETFKHRLSSHPINQYLTDAAREELLKRYEKHVQGDSNIHLDPRAISTVLLALLEELRKDTANALAYSIVRSQILSIAEQMLDVDQNGDSQPLLQKIEHELVHWERLKGILKNDPDTPPSTPPSKK